MKSFRKFSENFKNFQKFRNEKFFENYKNHFRHNSLSPVCQDRFERRFSEIDKNNDGLIDQGEIQKELQSRQQTIPYKEIKINEPTVNNARIAPKNGFKDGIFIRFLIFNQIFHFWWFSGNWQKNKVLKNSFQILGKSRRLWRSRRKK